MASDDADRETSRPWKTLATVALVLVMLSPAVRDGDGVPLSSYPMYATPRSDVLEFVVPVALAEDGGTVSLSTQTIAATNDPLVAESFLRREVAAGRARVLCEEIAARAKDDTNIVAVEIRLERHRVVERIREQDSLTETRSLASCST